jgi:hypothetical protein
MWEIDEHARLFIEPNAAQAGAGRITRRQMIARPRLQRPLWLWRHGV